MNLEHYLAIIFCTLIIIDGLGPRYLMKWFDNLFNVQDTG